jgi:hypothetical protein
VSESVGGSRERRSGLILGLCLLLGGALALRNRFVLDDAFISFQYARSLAEGSGLTWFGTRIEGYTNFLWVLWITLGLRLGADAVVWAHIGSIGAFLAAIVAYWELAHAMLASRLAGTAAVVLFVTNYSVACFATSGLETMLQTACLTGAAALVYAMWDEGRVTMPLGLGFSLLAALATLTRLDSLLPLAVLAGTLVLALPRSAWRRRGLMWLLVPGLMLVVPWLAWKLVYYGRLFPNSFYAKAGGTGDMALNGLLYLGRFLQWYWLWPVIALSAVVCVARRQVLPSRLLPPIVIVGTWFLYIVWAGGDFMEFRFLVPVAPFLFLVIAYGIHRTLGVVAFGRPALATAALTALLVLASARHAATFRGCTKDLSLDSIPALANFYGVYEDGNWGRIGRGLRREVGDLQSVLALHAVGAVPYYGRLRTVDIFGLNEPGIEAVGLRAPAGFRRPGHQRQVPIRYLRERGVNFVLGHPKVIPRGSLRTLAGTDQIAHWLAACVGYEPEPPARATLVAIPIDPGHALVAWYLAATPSIDRRIRERGWELVELRSREGPK